MEPCHHQQLKRHAQLRHQPRSTPLWVGDPDDWALVRQTPRPPLVCPEPGCDVELISYENLKNQYNPPVEANQLYELTHALPRAGARRQNAASRGCPSRSGEPA
jgi:hypothetical protein